MEVDGHTAGRPSSGAWSNFHGQGVQNSGNFHVGGSLNIGVHDLSEPASRFLADLRSTDPRDDKARIERTKGGLLRDSYRWIIDHDDFRRWRDDKESRLLWIKGDPGKGKTMLLCGIINELGKLPTKSHLLAYFFCQATDVRLNNAAAVLRGLIYLLLCQRKSLLARVREKYDHAGKSLFEDVNSWDALSRMLFVILQDPSLRNTYLIIDALDECETGLDQLLHLILELSSSTQAKLIVSSRNWPSIEQKLQTAGSRAMLSLELKENAEQVSRAIEIYITRCVSELSALQGDAHLQDQIRRKIQDKANGTFLWVALVVQELREAQSWEVEEVMDEVPVGLNELYERMMRQIKRLGRKNPDFCQQLLSTVVTAYRPMHLEELRVLTSLPPNISNSQQNVTKIAAMCGSFLTIRDDIVYIIHQSAKDFLKADRFLFPSGIVHEHDAIFSRSLQVMSRTLRRDAYNLGAPGFAIDHFETPDPDPLAPVRYSCLHWVNHLIDASTGGHQHSEIRDDGSVDVFLRRHYLHWLEALSLMRSLSQGIVAVSQLLSLAESHFKSPILTSLIRDALRFIRYHRVGIESSPLEVYNSALVFSPARSIIREQYRTEEPGWISIKPGVEDEWNACLQTFEGHDNSVVSVAVSRDGCQLASASWDGTTKLWDMTTGQCERTLESGRYLSIKSVAFSHDGRQLASASSDATVKLWDTTTGRCEQTLKGHNGGVNSIAFSHDSCQLASAWDHGTIELWDTTTGRCKQAFEGHSSSVESVAFSHDSRQLASASYDGNVKLWDTATSQCKCQWTLEGHSDWVTSVAFSRDDYQLASASHDGTIKLWDITTGLCTQTLEGHGGWVNSVTFLHNSHQLASAWDDGTIKLWDIITGQCEQTLEGHSDRVTSVAFSQDSCQLVSASHDTTIKLWDIIIGQYKQTLDRHHDSVLSIAFSRNGRQLASASADHTVKLWDITTGQCKHTLEGHGGLVWSVAFSHDDCQLVSASKDSTIKVWDTTTGQCKQTLEGHSGWIISIAFSYDSRQLVSTSQDDTVKLWDITTGQCKQTFEGFSSRVNSIAFSHDDCQLASAWDNGTIKLWDITKGQYKQALEGHSDEVTSIAFSRHGCKLASASKDSTIKLWNTTTGQCEQVLEGPGVWVNSVAFSHDGRQLASATSYGIIALQDTATGSYERVFDLGRRVDKLAFSETGLQLHTDIGTIGLEVQPATSSNLLLSATSTKAPQFIGHNLWEWALDTGRRLYTIAFSEAEAEEQSIETPCLLGYGVSVDGAWVTKDSRNILWLPSEYRPVISGGKVSTVAVKGSTVAIGGGSGRVLLLHFSFRDST
ncbi:Vegetative incompatibility protein HET-E-1-like protein 15 [Colletotrichum truncatum]|uniref:Vegetative incompatibility protein HET-E-1-like protein 15 n=1 Tax=Colletotrichum truncatum TaxID=5467 RepID=A0ACC3YUA2_COLTU|nr:Vegetative incompatibility protein HET-E-1-like protein 15 [Colletotrichum truncatum]KAF6798667.1 Vegetative incompatibility protein HET-E-1-like protein 15 [Colletotrichum truncatum]